MAAARAGRCLSGAAAGPLRGQRCRASALVPRLAPELAPTAAAAAAVAPALAAGWESGPGASAHRRFFASGAIGARAGTSASSDRGDSVDDSLGRTQALGFRRYEHGLEWYSSKDKLIQSSPKPVAVGVSYEFLPSDPLSDGQVKQARKYSSIENHDDFLRLLDRFAKKRMLHNFHEVFLEDQPRCLYFDIDGVPEYRDAHEHIIEALRGTLREVFDGDGLGWPEGSPEPVVLRSGDERKYSCHLHFPEVQFESYEQQCEYMPLIFASLPRPTFLLEDGEERSFLTEVVDKVPYNSFQLLRGPFACKFSKGELRPQTQFVPQGLFRDDPRTWFAGFAHKAYALPLASREALLARDPELNQVIRQASAAGAKPQDQENLLSAGFQQPGSTGVVDFAGLSELEKYELLLQWIHPARASQWWSWWRVSGVTARMIGRYSHREADQQRVWAAHCRWSSSFRSFCEQENREVVEKAMEVERLPGLRLLCDLARWDNPGMQFRFQ